MRLTGRTDSMMIVEHTGGYVLIFQVADDMNTGMHLFDSHWEGIGPAPDLTPIEGEARRFAEHEVRAQVS